MARQPRLTILRALGLGELLTAVPALRALARAFPEHRRVLAAPHRLAPLLPLLVEQGESCVHGLAECDDLEADPAALPGWPEVAVNLHDGGPESHRLLLATGPVRLIAFRHDAVPETAAMPRWRAGEQEAERWCRMLRSSGIPADPTELSISRPTSIPPDWACGATLLHPGVASGQAWPPERWAEIAAAEREVGRTVLISGSCMQAELGRWIAAKAGLPRSAVLAGQTDLLTLAAYVAAAGTVLSGDPAVAQLATAVGVPSLDVSRQRGVFGADPLGNSPGMIFEFQREGNDGDWEALGISRTGDHGFDIDQAVAALDATQRLTPGTYRVRALEAERRWHFGVVDEQGIFALIDQPSAAR